MTSHERKKIMEMKKMNPFHDGRLSSALYMMNTQPSWDAATYTVKKLVARTHSKSSRHRGSDHPHYMGFKTTPSQGFRSSHNPVSICPF